MGITPIFSPSIGSEKRLKASLISPSSCAETLCSFASLERGAALVAVVWEALPPDLRFGGWTSLVGCDREAMKELTMAVGGCATPVCWIEDVGRKERILKFTGVDVTTECVKQCGRNRTVPRSTMAFAFVFEISSRTSIFSSLDSTINHDNCKCNTA